MSGSGSDNLRTLQALSTGPDLGYELLAPGDTLIFGTARISLELQPIISISGWMLDGFEGVSIFPWSLFLLMLGSGLAILGAFFSTTCRRHSARTLLGLAGPGVLAHSVFAAL